MERFCGLLGIVAWKGRRHPNALIANRMHQHALILYFDAQYDLGLHCLFRAGCRKALQDVEDEDPGRVPGSKQFCAACRPVTNQFAADLRLSVPTSKGFVPDATTRRQIAKYFPILVTGPERGRWKIKDFKRLLPDSMTRWNRLQILAGGDCIRCINTDSSRSMAGKRDNSRVCESM
jgi:hypothetical protein